MNNVQLITANILCPSVLSMNDFFFHVKQLMEDYMYVDCNTAKPSPQYEEVPVKNHLKSSHIYLDIVPYSSTHPQPECSHVWSKLRGAKCTPRVLPRANTVSAVRQSVKGDSSAVNQTTSEPASSTLTRTQSVPSLLIDVQLKKHLRRSASSQASLDQDGYTVVRRPHLQSSHGGLSSTFPIRSTPPALPPRPCKRQPTKSERPLPDPPASHHEMPKVSSRQSLPPPIPRRPTHTMGNRRHRSAQSSFASSSLLRHDKQMQLPGSVPLNCFSTGHQIPRNGASSSVPTTLPLVRKDDCTDFLRQQPLYKVSEDHSDSTWSPDSPCGEVFPFSLPDSHHGTHTLDHVMKEDNHGKNGSTSSSSDDDSDVMVDIVNVVSQYQDSRMSQALELLSPTELVRSASVSASRGAFLLTYHWRSSRIQYLQL